MNPNKYLILSTLICLAGFLIVSILVETGNMTGFDKAVTAWILDGKSYALDRLSHFMSLIGEPKLLVAIAASLAAVGLFVGFFFLRHRFSLIYPSLALFVAINLVAYILEHAFKNFFQRPRPVPEITTFSFPSGHAMLSLTFNLTIAYLLYRIWKYFWAHTCGTGGIILAFAGAFMTLVMGFSRIYLGRHFPSDILAGFFLSGAIFSAGIIVLEYVHDRCNLPDR